MSLEQARSQFGLLSALRLGERPPKRARVAKFAKSRNLSHNLAFMQVSRHRTKDVYPQRFFARNHHGMCADGPAQKSRRVPPHVLGATAFSTIFRLGHTPDAHTYTSFKTLFEGYPPRFFARIRHEMCADGPAKKSRRVPPQKPRLTALSRILVRFTSLWHYCGSVRE